MKNDFYTIYSVLVSLSSPPPRSFLPLCSFNYMPSFSLSLLRKQTNKQREKRKKCEKHTHTQTHAPTENPEHHKVISVGTAKTWLCPIAIQVKCSSYLPNQKPEAPPKPKARPVLYTRFYFLAVLQEAFLIPSSPLPIHLHRCSSRINVFS